MDGGPYLAVVDANNASNHLWDDDHVSEMGLDGGGLFVWRSCLLCFPELLDESQGLALETALEPTACASVDELNTRNTKKYNSMNTPQA